MAIVPFLICSSMLNFFNLGGLIEEINFIFLINAIVPHLVKITFDVGYFIKLLKRYTINKMKIRFLLKRFMDERKGGPYTQKQANEIMENPEYNISDSYSYVFSTLGAAMFYFSIFPLGIVYAILSLLIHFWVQKVIL